MSRGGRGFSPRGSFRGRGDSWNSGGSRGRGTFTGPSRGRFNWFKDNSSSHFESRRYSGSSSGERYATRGRGEDTGYRRYGRTDVPSYTSRDRSHHRSPESSHKRVRTDSYNAQASSSRRSHDGNYGSGNDYNNRYSYSEDKGSGYVEERGRYREERRSSGGGSGGFRDRSREDYSHRKPDHLSMPPPSPRHLASTRPRGTYRGRFAFRGTRGYTRVSLARRTDALLARKRVIADSYVIRKRILTAKLQADSLRRLKIQKLRRLKEAALIRKAEKIQKALKATEDISDEDAKEEEDEEDEEDKEKMEDEELEEGETVDKKEKPKIKKSKVKAKKEKIPEEEREEGEEVDDDEEEEDEEQDLDEEEDLDDKDDEMKGESGVQVTIKHDSDKRDVSEDGRRWQPGFRRQFIRLSCPHCYFRCVTFKEYAMHLYAPKHVSAMRRLSLQHKQRLVCMRLTQRQKQRELEETEEEEGSLAPRTSFCHICKLNFRQQKAQHMMSELHKAMKNFLVPFCRICRISFKSPMLYENHTCSLDHIKRKARIEERVSRLKNEDNGSGSDIDGDEKEVDLENFMILDSVGDADADADADADENMEEGSDEKEKTEGEEKEKPKKEVNLGADFIRKLEVLFCELCHIYLPRLDNKERAMAIHCRNRGHLQRYVHYRDDRALRKKAESIHRKEAEKAEAKKNTEEKKKEEEASKSEDAVAIKEEKTTPETNNDTAGKKAAVAPKEKKTLDLVSDETLWADVDNLLVLADRDCTHENKSSDEDEEGDRGRYDRFGTSSKKATVVKPSSDPDLVVLETEETATSEKDEPSSQADEESTEKVVAVEDDAEVVAPAEDAADTAVE